MPELPEVETVRAGLASLIVGSTITGVEVRRDSCVRHEAGGAGEFAARLQGTRIDAIARRGKFMWAELSEAAAPRLHAPQEALVAHLGMSGQFRVHQDAPEPHAHCRARLMLASAGGPLTLDFLDQRTFGYLRTDGLVPTPDGRAAGQGSASAWLPASAAHIARDALDPALDVSEAIARFRKGSRGIKQVLLDQTVVSGIGNIYADEALWLARVHPQRPAHAMTRAQAVALLDATRTVMSEALAQGGTSFDALYVNVNGESGYFSRSLKAYGQTGKPCERCGRALVRESIGGRATHWCPQCQRRPAGRSR